MDGREESGKLSKHLRKRIFIIDNRQLNTTLRLR
jgi:hypothetical protein